MLDKELFDEMPVFENYLNDIIFGINGSMRV